MDKDTFVQTLAPDVAKRVKTKKNITIFSPDIRRLRPRWWKIMHSGERQSSVHQPNISES